MRRMAFMLAVFFAAGTLIAADIPVVATQFVITGRAFTSGMGEEKVRAERGIGAAIARLAEEKYPFFRWREESETTKPAAKFVVTLVEVPVDDTRSSFHLEYQRQVSPAWRAAPLKLGASADLYSAGKRSKPYSDRQTLGADVVRWLTDQLDNVHKSDFENGFIHKVPLCSCSAAVADGHTIVIKGFAWANLKATKGSLLFVDIAVRKLPSDGPEFIPAGWIHLTNLEPSAIGIAGHLGDIHCANADLTQWDQQRILEALDGQRVQKFAVYVYDYTFDDTTQPEENPDL